MKEIMSGLRKEEMVERFKLCGEIFCQCSELEQESDYMDDFRLEWYEINEQLNIGKMHVNIDEEDDNVLFDGIEFTENMPSVMFVSSNGYSQSIAGIYVSTDTLRRIIKVIEDYLKALKS